MLDEREKIRGFIAVKLPERLQEAIDKLQSRLRIFIPHARWTNPQSTHLTLKFLGDVERTTVEQLKEILDSKAQAYTAFSLTVNGLGAFPRLSSPRVIWVGTRVSDRLMALQGDIETALEPLGFEAERRSFKGHLTLARLKGYPWDADIQKRFNESAHLVNGIELPVGGIALFMSELKPEGALHTQLHYSSLKGKA